MGPYISDRSWTSCKVRLNYIYTVAKVIMLSFEKSKNVEIKGHRVSSPLLNRFDPHAPTKVGV